MNNSPAHVDPVIAFLTGLLIVISWLSTAVFVGLMLRTDWRRRVIGRSEMTLACVILTVLTLAVIGTFAPHWAGRPTLRFLSFAAIAAALTQRTVVLMWNRAEARRREREQK